MFNYCVIFATRSSTRVLLWTFSPQLDLESWAAQPSKNDKVPKGIICLLALDERVAKMTQ